MGRASSIGKEDERFFSRLSNPFYLRSFCGVTSPLKSSESINGLSVLPVFKVFLYFIE